MTRPPRVLHDRTQEDQQVVVSREEFDALRSELTELRTDVKGLVDAWRAGTTLIAFVKLCASIVTALTIIWAAIKLGSHVTPPHP